MSHDIRQRYLLPVPTRYVPKGHRKVHYAIVMRHESLMLTVAGGHEAPVAFRLFMKSEDLGPRVWELRYFEGKIWWPVIVELALLQAPTFLLGLERGDGYCLELLDKRLWNRGWPHPINEDQLVSVKLKDNDGDQMFARAARGASRILLCDGIVYRQGGDPIFVCIISDKEGPNQKALIKIENPQNLTMMAEFEFDRSASRGEVFRADEIMRGLASLKKKRIPTVVEAEAEIILSEAFSIDLLLVQVAACVRTLLTELRKVSKASEEDLVSLKSIIIMLEKLAAENMIFDDANAPQNKTDFRDGLSAMLHFHQWANSNACLPTSKYRSAVKFTEEALDRIEIECAQRGVKFQVALDEVDDEALALCRV